MLDMLAIKVADNPSIYFHRETLAQTLEKRKVELLTISSYDRILEDKEKSTSLLYPGSSNTERPHKFAMDKKIVFVSARVHPGESP